MGVHLIIMMYDAGIFYVTYYDIVNLDFQFPYLTPNYSIE